MLGTTPSGSDGSFSFSGIVGCSTNQVVYLAEAGGNGGAGINNNILNVAVLGYPTDANCDGLPTNVVVNEVTTVATAYAFSSFLSLSGTRI